MRPDVVIDREGDTERQQGHVQISAGVAGGSLVTESECREVGLRKNQESPFWSCV